MKQTLQAFFLLVVFIITSSAVQAQRSIPEAYLITNSSETIRGQIVKESVSKMLHSIQFGEPGNYKTYLAADVKGYGIGDSIRFESKEVLIDEKTSTVFLQLLVDGPTKLYYTQHLQPLYRYFVQKQQGPIVPLHQTYYTGTLSALLSDCENISFQGASSTQRSYKYNSSSLSGLIQSYNECVFPGQATQQLFQKKKMILTPGFRAGFHTSTLIFDNDAGAVYQKDAPWQQGLTFGFLLNMSVGNRFSVQPELLYTSRKAHGLYTQLIVTDKGSFYARNAININTHLIQLPVLVKYRFSLGNTQPYLNGGISYSKSISNESNFYSAIRNSNYEIANYFTGFVFGGGISKKLVNDKRILLELRLNRDITNSKGSYQRLAFTTATASIGITL